jgi:ADP-ribose pyrophosphatase
MDHERPDFDFTEHRLASETLCQGRVLEFRKDAVRLPDGNSAHREYVVHPGAVIIIPLLDAATVVLEYQFRYPLGRHFYELPAGKLEPGEDELATAQRELLEETGYTATRWHHLGVTHPCIGYSTERIDYFIARDLSYLGHKRDQGEFLEVIPTPIEQALQWVDEGIISDTKTIVGLLRLDRMKRAGTL